MKIHDRIKMLREARKWDQAELARQVGTSQQNISRLERKFPKNSFYLVRLARVFEVSVEYLQYGEENGNIDQNIGKEVLLHKGALPILTFEDICQYDKEVLMSKVRNPDDLPLMSVFKEYQKDCFAMIVQGDSMQSPHSSGDSFLDGHELIINPHLAPRHNNFVIAKDNANKAAYFRQYSIDNGIPYLKPLNPQYPILKITNDIIIVGVLIRAQVGKDYA